MKLDLKLGQKAVWQRRIEAEHVRMYRDVTGDANPLHFDEAYARATTFGRLIVHGEVVWLHDSKPVCRLEVRVTARGPSEAAERICIKGQCIVYRAAPG